MGNAESRALTAPGAINDAAVTQAHAQYLTYNKGAFPVDRAAFGLFFAAEHVPFAAIDQAYDAVVKAAEARDAVVVYPDVALAVVAASALPLQEKLAVLYDLCAPPDVQFPLAPEHIADALAALIHGACVAIRGIPSPDGRVRYPAMRCTACREVPVNLVHCCEECSTPYHVLGVPVAPLLCRQCVAVWEGPFAGRHDVFHRKTHATLKIRSMPNPKVPAFPGVCCSSCGASPVTEFRVRCLECTDACELCPSCFAGGECPAAHVPSHGGERIATAQTAQQEVARFLAALGLTSPALSAALPSAAAATSSVVASDPGVGSELPGAPMPMAAAASRDAFVAWGLRTERVVVLLGGHCTHYVPRCADTEGFEMCDPRAVVEPV